MNLFQQVFSETITIRQDLLFFASMLMIVSLLTDEFSNQSIVYSGGGTSLKNDQATEHLSFYEHFWGNASVCTWSKISWNVNYFVSGKYPLSPSRLQQSFTQGSKESWDRVFEMLERGENIAITVLGGSMTTGLGCGPRDSDGTFLSCAWSTYVSDWLTRQYPSWKFTLKNIAIGGMSAGSWFSWPQISESDVYIIDTTVNSQIYCNARQSENSLSQITIDMANLLNRLSTRSKRTGVSPALLMVQTFRTCSNEKSDCEGHCKKEELKSLPDVDYSWCECWWRMGDFEAFAARSVDIPIASYRDAVWPDIDNPPLDLPFFWNGLSHPDRVAHELVSDIVKNALEQLLIPSVQDIENPKVDLSIESEANLYLSDCASRSSQSYPSTIIGVQDLAKFASTAISAGSAWRVYEDRPLKPGWIGSWANNNFLNTSQIPLSPDKKFLTLSFNLVLSSSPRLEITFLRSYEGMSDVRVSIEDCGEIDEIGGTLSGLWEQHYSLPFSTVWESQSTVQSADTENLSFRLFNKSCSLHRGGSQLLTFTLLHPGKFKLLSISSC